jgi:hypothetical protein
LSFRNVNVISAFDPSPPRRQDCDEILKPLTAAGSLDAVGLSSGLVGSGVASALP